MKTITLKRYDYNYHSFSNKKKNYTHNLRMKTSVWQWTGDGGDKATTVQRQGGHGDRIVHLVSCCHPSCLLTVCLFHHISIQRVPCPPASLDCSASCLAPFLPAQEHFKCLPWMINDF